jgi:hypothetical protein
MLLMMLTLDSDRIIHHCTNTALELRWALPSKETHSTVIGFATLLRMNQ